MTNQRSYPVLLLLLAILFAASPASAADNAAGSVVYLSGEVSAIRGTNVIALKTGSPVYASDSIVTGNRGRAKLAMRDGSSVYIGRNSRISLEEYTFREGSLLTGAFNMLWGKARFIVEKLRGRNALYSVKTTTAVLGVRGTNFIVVVGMPAGVNPLQTGTPALPPLPTRVLLAEGLLQLKAVPAGREAMLKAGRLAVISPAGQIDIRPYTPEELKEMGANVSEMLETLDSPTAPGVATPTAPDVTVPVIVRPPSVVWGTQQVTTGARGQTPTTTTIQVPVSVQPPVIVEKKVK